MVYVSSAIVKSHYLKGPNSCLITGGIVTLTAQNAQNAQLALEALHLHLLAIFVYMFISFHEEPHVV